MGYLVRVPISASDEELLRIVQYWLDVLATEDYEKVFENIGYAVAFGAGAEAIRRDIKCYRSQELYPGVSDFRVTNWRTAVGGNPDTDACIRRFKGYTEDLPIVATVDTFLPLNGRWSDLSASFVVTVTGPDEAQGWLALEDITPSRYDDDT